MTSLPTTHRARGEVPSPVACADLFLIEDERAHPDREALFIPIHIGNLELGQFQFVKNGGWGVANPWDGSSNSSDNCYLLGDQVIVSSWQLTRLRLLFNYHTSVLFSLSPVPKHQGVTAAGKSLLLPSISNPIRDENYSTSSLSS